MSPLPLKQSMSQLVGSFGISLSNLMCWHRVLYSCPLGKEESNMDENFPRSLDQTEIV